MTIQTIWFVYPKNAHTNETISRFVEQGTSGFETRPSEVLCEDGTKRRLWQASRQDAQQLWDSRNDLGLKLEIFNQRGNGKIRNVTLIFTDNFKKGRRSKKMRSQKKLF